MKFKDFIKIFKGDLLTVRDSNRTYQCADQKDIEDRDIESITNDEQGLHILLVKDICIPVVDFLCLCEDDVIKVYNEELKTTSRVTRKDAMCGFRFYKVTKYCTYDGYLTINVRKL